MSRFTKVRHRVQLVNMEIEAHTYTQPQFGELDVGISISFSKTCNCLTIVNSNLLFIPTCLSGEGHKAKQQHSAQLQDDLVSERDVNMACPLLLFKLLDLAEKTFSKEDHAGNHTSACPTELIKNRFESP